MRNLVININKPQFTSADLTFVVVYEHVTRSTRKKR